MNVTLESKSIGRIAYSTESIDTFVLFYCVE